MEKQRRVRRERIWKIRHEVKKRRERLKGEVERNEKKVGVEMEVEKEEKLGQKSIEENGEIQLRKEYKELRRSGGQMWVVWGAKWKRH